MSDVSDGSQPPVASRAAEPAPAALPGAHRRSTANGRPWRRAWLTGLSVWAAAEVTYLLLNALFWMTRSEAGPPVAGFLDVWNRWDTGHYVTISSHGYSPVTENGAFFPLYPLLMAILDPVLPGEKLAAGLVVAAAACIAALAVIHRLVEDLFDTEMAQRTALYLMAFPFAFYLVAAYNESLFLALAVASLYFMRRGNWWYAGVLAGFSTAARQAGVFLALAFAIEYMRQRGWKFSRVRWDALAVALVPTGMFAFMIYSAYELGDALRFMHVQSYWGRGLSLPWTGTLGALKQMGEVAETGRFFHVVFSLNAMDLVAVPVTLALIVLSLVGPWKLGQESWYLIAFGAATFVMVLLTPIGEWLPPLHGVPRYALEILPAFMVVARMGANRYVDRAYLFPAIGVQSALVLAYFYGVWLS